MDFYQSWWFIHDHPKLNTKNQNVLIDVFVAKINPATNKIDDNPTLNTVTQVWVELMTTAANGIATHHVNVDIGGPTYEEAIIALAQKVKEKYGE